MGHLPYGMTAIGRGFPEGGSNPSHNAELFRIPDQQLLIRHVAQVETSAGAFSSAAA
jgi:hypothetical protein